MTPRTHLVVEQPSVRLMADKGWQRKFEDLIPLPKRRQLVTLKDAADRAGSGNLHSAISGVSA